MNINNYKLTISILESIYIIYMFNYFETSYNIAHPITYFNNKILYHPIGNGKKQNLICPMGNYGSYIIALYLICRNFIDKRYWVNINKCLMIIILGMSFLNFNAVLYFLPLFIVEMYYIN